MRPTAFFENGIEMPFCPSMFVCFSTEFAGFTNARITSYIVRGRSLLSVYVILQVPFSNVWVKLLARASAPTSYNTHYLLHRECKQRSYELFTMLKNLQFLTYCYSYLLSIIQHFELSILGGVQSLPFTTLHISHPLF